MTIDSNALSADLHNTVADVEFAANFGDRSFNPIADLEADPAPNSVYRSADNAINVNDDGSFEVYSNNRGLTERAADGSLTLTTPLGGRIEVDAKNTITAFDADGTALPLGELPDGVVVGSIAGDGSFEVELGNGSFHVRDTNGNYGFTDADGNATQLNADGTFFRQFTDMTTVELTSDGTFRSRDHREDDTVSSISSTGEYSSIPTDDVPLTENPLSLSNLNDNRIDNLFG